MNKEGQVPEYGLFQKLIGGHFGLAITFWVFGVLIGNVALGFLIPLSASSKNVPITVVFLLAYLLYLPVVTLGIWRSASKYRGLAVWSGLAKIVAVVSWVQYGILFVFICSVVFQVGILNFIET